MVRRLDTAAYTINRCCELWTTLLQMEWTNEAVEMRRNGGMFDKRCLIGPRTVRPLTCGLLVLITSDNRERSRGYGPCYHAATSMTARAIAEKRWGGTPENV
jgi:hypothetical protein